MANSGIRRVLAGENLPFRMPLWPTVTLWLVLDRLHAAGWVWGLAGLFLLLYWGVWINDVHSREPVTLDDLTRNHKE